MFTYDVHAYSDIINFTNSIVLDKARNKGEKHIRYKLEKWNKMSIFDVLDNISKHVTLMQLMYSLGNVNHSVGVDGNFILI